MKFLKVIFLILLIVIIMVTIVVFIVLKNFDLDQYRGRITSQISNALGRPVSMGHIGLKISLVQGISMSLQDLSIADDPAFAQGPFLTLKSADLQMDPVALLTQRKILVSHVVLNSPKLIIIRHADGQINVQQLAILKSQSRPPHSAIPEVPVDIKSIVQPDAPPSVSAESLPNIFIESIEIRDGTKIFIDESFSPKLSIEASQITVKISGFSLTEPFKISASSAVFSPAPNFRMDATAQLKMSTSSAELKDMVFTTDLSKLDLAQLQKSLPMIPAENIPQGVAGMFTATAKEMEIGPSGLNKISAHAEFSNGLLKFEQLASPLQNINASVDADTTNVNVTKFSLEVGRGTVEGVAAVKNYLSTQDFSADIHVKQVELDRVLKQENQPVQLKGKLNAEFKGTGKGLDPERLMSSLAGSGTLNIEDGLLAGLNILNTLLDKMSIVPDLRARVEQNLPEKYKEKLNEKDTVLSKVEAQTTIASGLILLSNLSVAADEFELSGQGQMAFDQTIAMNMAISITQDLSQSMATSVPELQYILAEDGRITFPVKLAGKVPAISVLPDLQYLGQRILANQGRQEIEKALDKVFDKGEEGQPEGEDPNRATIESIMNAIFK